MKRFYHKSESLFEKFAEGASKVFGNSLTFMVAVILVIVYLASTPFTIQSFHNSIYDIILCFTFLGFFIIQKSINKYNRALNLKINELVSTHDNASNRMVNIETLTEAELHELGKHYIKIADESAKSGELHTPTSIEQIMERELDDIEKNVTESGTTDKKEE